MRLTHGKTTNTYAARLREKGNDWVWNKRRRKNPGTSYPHDTKSNPEGYKQEVELNAISYLHTQLHKSCVCYRSERLAHSLRLTTWGFRRHQTSKWSKEMTILSLGSNKSLGRSETSRMGKSFMPGSVWNYYLRKPLKAWLEQCIKDIFEEVPEEEPVIWCSPFVVQPKPKFRDKDKEDLEPHKIRASVDLRVPNQLMERHRTTQGMMVEDFMYKFHYCTIFSKLDMRQGYHQLLDSESRKVATFRTP